MYLETYMTLNTTNAFLETIIPYGRKRAFGEK